MKRTATFLLSCAIGLGTLNFPVMKADSASETITVSPYSIYEINDGKFEGWGTSLCWWANRIGYSDSLSEQSAEAFFGESGLRMNIARFNIGGGDDPSHTHITRTDSDMPGYTVYKNGSVAYDFNADSAQRNVLMKSIDACKDNLIVEMFSNSPPYYMTNSGCSSGNTDGGKNNLKDDQYDDFAEYFATVCEYYHKNLGVDIQSVTPMNEPYTNFWYAGSPKQEGCHFDIGNSQSKILVELNKAMQKHGLGDVIISSSDETSIDTAINAYNALSDEAKKIITRIDTHTYSGSQRSKLKDTAKNGGENLWMSEVDGGAVAGKDAGQMGAALWLSTRIAADLNGMNPSAWVLWQAIDRHICSAGYKGRKDTGMPDLNGGYWGLAIADHDKNNLVLTKKYYAFGQFSRYIRPGYTMLNVSGDNVAAYDSENNRFVIVCVNASANTRNVDFDLSQFTEIGNKVQVIRTSGDVQNGENWKELAPIDTYGNGFSASLIPNSVTTFIIDGTKAESLEKTEIKIDVNKVSGSESWHNDSKSDCTKVFDGNSGTYFDGLGNGYVQVDLGENYRISALEIIPRSGYEYRCVDASISFSSDGKNWSEAYKINSKPVSGANYYTALKNNKNVRYVRYQTPDGKPTNEYNKDDVYCCNLAEMKIFGTPVDFGNKIDVSSDMISGSQPWRNDSKFDCTKVIDGNTDTYFDGLGNGYVQIDLGKNYNIKTVGFAPRKNYSYRCVDAVISCSADGVNWTEISKIKNVPSDGLNYISVGNAENIRYIRYQTPEGKPDNQYINDDSYCCNLSEIEIYGDEPEKIKGDVNMDGIFDKEDVLALQNWLLNVPNTKLADWKAADLCEDEILDVFDLCEMKKLL